MPVSYVKLRVENRPAGTSTRVGRMPPIAGGRASRTLYVPGGSAIRYRPRASVVVVQRRKPKMKISPVRAAGAVQGSDALQTGRVGPRVTTPWRPLVRVSAARRVTRADTVSA